MACSEPDKPERRVTKPQSLKFEFTLLCLEVNVNEAAQLQRVKLYLFRKTQKHSDTLAALD